MKRFEASILLSTYNAEVWLEKVLWGYTLQTFRNFEIVIADDGSRPATRDLIEAFKSKTEIPIKHVWHEDQGFQKSVILNKAILACDSDYIIMSDGDCIPRKDFVATHIKYRELGYFLSGGYHKLSMKTSKNISKEDILKEKCFSRQWLGKNGMKSSHKNFKLSNNSLLTQLLNGITSTKATWNGHNASGWKRDIIKVNGFDERMQYGGQDRELGERLMNMGIVGKQIRYFAVCLHLDHSRGYKSKESIDKNRKIRELTKRQKISKTNFGLDKYITVEENKTI